VVTTFDLGVCMKAYPIIWNQPKKFEDHIIMIGVLCCVRVLQDDREENGRN
jgi:hypothetical protein